MEFIGHIIRKNGYQLGPLLGQGMSSMVYTIIDEGKKKALHISKQTATQYLNEGVVSPIELDILCRLKHPNLLSAEKVFCDPECSNIAYLLPFYPRSYATYLAEGKVNALEVLSICFKIISATKFLLDNNILHLDIKPDNIMLSEDLEPVLIDFDICARMDNCKIPIYLNREVCAFRIRPYELLRNPDTAVGEHSLVWQLAMLICLSFYPSLPEVAKPSDLVEYIESRYTNYGKTVETLNRHFKLFLNETFMVDVIDLVANMLSLDVNTRYTLDKVLSHPVWLNVNTKNSIMLSPIQIKQPKFIDCNQSIERLYTFVLLVYSFNHSGCLLPSGIFFSAVDLLYRSIALVEDGSTKDLIIHEITCTFIAWKLYNCQAVQSKLNLSNNGYLIANPYAIIHNITKKNIITMENNIISYLEGILYRPFLYDSVDEAVTAMNEMIFNAKAYHEYKPIKCDIVRMKCNLYLLLRNKTAKI